VSNANRLTLVMKHANQIRKRQINVLTMIPQQRSSKKSLVQHLSSSSDRPLKNGIRKDYTSIHTHTNLDISTNIRNSDSSMYPTLAIYTGQLKDVPNLEQKMTNFIHKLKFNWQLHKS